MLISSLDAAIDDFQEKENGDFTPPCAQTPNRILLLMLCKKSSSRQTHIAASDFVQITPLKINSEENKTLLFEHDVHMKEYVQCIYCISENAFDLYISNFKLA